MIILIVVVAVIALAAKWLSDGTAVPFGSVVERHGSDALGTRVDVENAHIDPADGSFSVQGLEIANPGGFSDGNMITISSIRAEGDLKAGVVRTLQFKDIDALIEFRGADSNFEEIGDRVSANTRDAGNAATAEDTENEGGGDEQGGKDADDESPFPDEWRLDTVSFDEIRVTVRADWTSKQTTFEAGSLKLEKLDGKKDDLVRSVVTGFLAGVLSDGARQVEDNRLKKALEERARALRQESTGAGSD